jgi:DNA-directed RNA polymerase subunit K/omega
MLMREEDVYTSQALDDEQNRDEAEQPQGSVVEAPASVEPAAPITNRFLLVNVTGQRARQLRLGAKPRFDPQDDGRLPLPKAERIAMEEVRRGLVPWEVPDWVPPTAQVYVEPPRRRSRSRVESRA